MSSIEEFLARNGSNIPYYRCHEVTPLCPVELTTLGYFPNKGINVFFAVTFGLAGAATLSVGIWKKTWSYMSFITAGCVLEMAGTLDGPLRRYSSALDGTQPPFSP